MMSRLGHGTMRDWIKERARPVALDKTNQGRDSAEGTTKDSGPQGGGWGRRSRAFIWVEWSRSWSKAGEMMEGLGLMRPSRKKDKLGRVSSRSNNIKHLLVTLPSPDHRHQDGARLGQSRAGSSHRRHDGP